MDILLTYVCSVTGENSKYAIRLLESNGYIVKHEGEYVLTATGHELKQDIEFKLNFNTTLQ